MRDCYQPDQSCVTLAASAVPILLTGTTLETAMAVIRVPGGLLGPHGLLEVFAVFTHTPSGGSEVGRIRFGSMGSTAAAVYAHNQSPPWGVHALVAARGSELSQVTVPGHTFWGNMGAVTAGVFATALDMRADQDVFITGQCGLGTDTMTLEFYAARLLNHRAP